jgi:hypothetical protein
MDTKDFNDKVKAFGQIIVPQAVKLLHQKVSIEAAQRLIEKTPVDTGRARGNWQVAIGARPTGEVNVADLLPKGDKPRTSLPSLAVSGQAAVDAAIEASSKIPGFCVSHVTNNVSYILKLEDGGSKQAPAGMMAVTMTELGEMFP